MQRAQGACDERACYDQAQQGSKDADWQRQQEPDPHADEQQEDGKTNTRHLTVALGGMRPGCGVSPRRLV